jgi:hypothetical protein
MNSGEYDELYNTTKNDLKIKQQNTHSLRNFIQFSFQFIDKALNMEGKDIAFEIKKLTKDVHLIEFVKKLKLSRNIICHNINFIIGYNKYNGLIYHEDPKTSKIIKYENIDYIYHNVLNTSKLRRPKYGDPGIEELLWKSTSYCIGKHRDYFRLDPYENLIEKCNYGKDVLTGWGIGHIVDNGNDDISNLQAMQWNLIFQLKGTSNKKTRYEQKKEYEPKEHKQKKEHEPKEHEQKHEYENIAIIPIITTVQQVIESIFKPSEFKYDDIKESAFDGMKTLKELIDRDSCNCIEGCSRCAPSKMIIYTNLGYIKFNNFIKNEKLVVSAKSVNNKTNVDGKIINEIYVFITNYGRYFTFTKQIYLNIHAHQLFTSFTEPVYIEHNKWISPESIKIIQQLNVAQYTHDIIQHPPGGASLSVSKPNIKDLYRNMLYNILK